MKCHQSYGKLEKLGYNVWIACCPPIYCNCNLEPRLDSSPLHSSVFTALQCYRDVERRSVVRPEQSLQGLQSLQVIAGIEGIEGIADIRGTAERVSVRSNRSSVTSLKVKVRLHLKNINKRAKRTAIQCTCHQSKSG